MAVAVAGAGRAKSRGFEDLVSAGFVLVCVSFWQGLLEHRLDYRINI